VTVVLARLRGLPSVQVTLALALLVLGFLVAAQIAAEGPRVRYTTEERSPLIETALGLQSQQDALKARILDLRHQIADLEGQDPSGAASLQALYAQLGRAQLAGGLVAVTGPGIAFKLEDGNQPGAGADALASARDVRTLVQELWLAGAEAIAVNGERVTATTAIIDIGGSTLVNSAYLAPAYTITAIGPADLYQRLQASVAFGQFVRDRVQGFGLGLSVAELQSVDIPAFAGTVTQRFARPAATPGASGTP
jgi:uncharacterized protein YlxW (UPF0749 family)